jgi:hypothetical protein
VKIYAKYSDNPSSKYKIMSQTGISLFTSNYDLNIESVDMHLAHKSSFYGDHVYQFLLNSHYACRSYGHTAQYFADVTLTFKLGT